MVFPPLTLVNLFWTGVLYFLCIFDKISIMKYVFSTFIWVLGVLNLILLFPPAIIIWLFTVLFDRNLKFLQQYSCFWASTFTWLNPFWKVKIYGREKIKKGQVYVLISNHQSLLDILVLYRLFKHFKWVAKRELFRFPLVGWNMTMNRYIPIKRGTRSSILQMMKKSEQTLLAGSSVMIFPEGTRSTDNQIKSFKEGAFRLAITTQTPILPIVLDGTGTALPKKGYLFKRNHVIEIHILDKIEVHDLSEKEMRPFTEKVRKIMMNGLWEIRHQ